jgi:hypothetical protein
MSFSASAKRARASDQPLGLRVTCLHECLEQFNLFGYHATRERLRLIVGASEPGWTVEQVVAAVEVLEHAKESWSRYAVAEVSRQRALKREHRNGHRASTPSVFEIWVDHYVRGEGAGLWLADRLGA